MIASYNSAIFFSSVQLNMQLFQHLVARFTETSRRFAINVGVDLPSFNAVMTSNEFSTLSKEQCIDTFAQDYVYGRRMLILVINASVFQKKPVAWVRKGNDKALIPGLVAPSSGCVTVTMTAPKVWQNKPLGLVRSRKTVVNSESAPSLPILGGVHFANGSLIIGPYNIPNMEDYRHLNDLLSKCPFKDELQARLDDSSAWVNKSFPGDVTIPGHEPSCGPDDKDEIFLTVEDAIASFLNPDPSTEGACLLSKSLEEKNTRLAQI